MHFVTISNIRPLPQPGTKFRMTSSMNLTADGTLKPGKEGKPFTITFQGLSPDKKTALYTRDDVEGDTNQELSVESTNWKIAPIGGGRRRRVTRRRLAGKTRRGRKH